LVVVFPELKERVEHIYLELVQER